VSIGAMVRRSFGPYEWHISEAWRRMFVDLDAFVGQMREWTDATNILEIGCGEGAVTERLVRHFPNARITAIDVAPNAGRLFRGDRSRVEFSQAFAEDVVTKRPAAFDLVILADVIHHVPLPLRRALLESARAGLAPGGRMVFKDWARRPTPMHLACALADRYLTGDEVHYHSQQELRTLATGVFGTDSIVAEGWIRPWKHNFAMLLQPSTTTA
jgi:2-polyprenyl-6-hydroxyphenyl methylase/3-demethylubiquinone-9 3-methyltransferase